MTGASKIVANASVTSPDGFFSHERPDATLPVSENFESSDVFAVETSSLWKLSSLTPLLLVSPLEGEDISGLTSMKPPSSKASATRDFAGVLCTVACGTCMFKKDMDTFRVRGRDVEGVGDGENSTGDVAAGDEVPEASVAY